MDPALSQLGVNGLPVNPDDWKTAGFRQKIIQSIEEAVRQSPSPINKNSEELENHVFSRSSNRQTYLGLVAKLILHLRDIKNQNHPQPQVQQPSAMHAGMTSDPINALQNMTQQSASAGIMSIQRMQGPRPDVGMPQPMPPQQMAPQPMVSQQMAQPQMVPQQVSSQQRPGTYPQQSMPGQPMNPYQTPVSPATSLQQYSPASVFLPPQSPQTSSSPASHRSSISSANVNTPSGGNPPSVGMAHSPSVKPDQEQIYCDKLKQLQKFIDPLSRMINKIKKNKDRKKDEITLSKLQNLLDVLSDPSKKLPMAALLKCEMALERMDLVRPGGGSSVQTKPTEHHHMCQPLIDMVAQHSKSPMLNHTLSRTFGPALNAIQGPPIRAPSPPAKRRKTDENDNQKAVPNVIQGEIARLSARFKVELDPTFSERKALHLLCQLDDKNLPSVPPLCIVVPGNYPANSPECSPLSEEYESSQFLKSVQDSLQSKMSQLSDKYSITALLNTWEMSVRQACRPPCDSDLIRNQ